MYVDSHGKEGGALIGGGALNSEFTVPPFGQGQSEMIKGPQAYEYTLLYSD